MPTIQSSAGKIAYDDAGSGTPILLVHGFPLDSRVWAEVAADLSKDFRVITLDLPGFGKSEPAGKCSIVSLADSVNSLAKHLALEKFVLAGLSMGGYVALAYASKFSGTLAGFVLVDSKPDADTADGRASREKMAAMIAEKGTPGVVEEMLPKMLAPNVGDTVKSTLRAIMSAQQPATLAQAVLAMRDRDDYTAVLGQLSLAVPVQLLVGEYDIITPVAMAEKARDAAAGDTRLTIIASAGHMSPLEQPEAVAGAIRRFLQSISA